MEFNCILLYDIVDNLIHLNGIICKVWPSNIKLLRKEVTTSPPCTSSHHRQSDRVSQIFHNSLNESFPVFPSLFTDYRCSIWNSVNIYPCWGRSKGYHAGAESSPQIFIKGWGLRPNYLLIIMFWSPNCWWSEAPNELFQFARLFCN